VRRDERLPKLLGPNNVLRGLVGLLTLTLTLTLTITLTLALTFWEAGGTAEPAPNPDPNPNLLQGPVGRVGIEPREPLAVCCRLRPAAERTGCLLLQVQRVDVQFALLRGLLLVRGVHLRGHVDGRHLHRPHGHADRLHQLRRRRGWELVQRRQAAVRRLRYRRRRLLLLRHRHRCAASPRSWLGLGF